MEKNALSDAISEITGTDFNAVVSVKLAPSTIPVAIISILVAVTAGIVAAHYIIKAID
jgi:hypothetical protein